MGIECAECAYSVGDARCAGCPSFSGPPRVPATAERNGKDDNGTARWGLGDSDRRAIIDLLGDTAATHEFIDNVVVHEVGTYRALSAGQSSAVWVPTKKRIERVALAAGRFLAELSALPDGDRYLLLDGLVTATKSMKHGWAEGRMPFIEDTISGASRVELAARTALETRRRERKRPSDLIGDRLIRELAGEFKKSYLWPKFSYRDPTAWETELGLPGALKIDKSYTPPGWRVSDEPRSHFYRLMMIVFAACGAPKKDLSSKIRKALALSKGYVAEDHPDSLEGDK